MLVLKRKKLLLSALVLLGLGASSILPSTETNPFIQSYFSLLQGFVLLMAVQGSLGLIYLSYRRWGSR